MANVETTTKLKLKRIKKHTDLRKKTLAGKTIGRGEAKSTMTFQELQNVAKKP